MNAKSNKFLSGKALVVFLILSATVAFAYQVAGLRFTFYDQMMTALSLDNTQMGFLATILAGVNTVAYFVGGFLADRFSTRNLMLVSLAGLAGTTFLFAFSTDYYMLMVVHALYGVFTVATLWTAYLNGIRNLGNAENQGKLFGFSEATRGVIQTIMGFLYVWVMGQAASVALGWRNTLLVGAVLLVVLFVLAFIFLPKQSIVREGDEESSSHYTIKDVVKNKGVWIVALLTSTAFSAWIIGNNYLTTYTVQVLGITPELASTLGVIRSYMIVVLAGFLGGWVVDKFTYKGKAFIVLFTCVIIAIASVMFTSKVVPVCIGITLVIAFVANIMKSTYWSVMDQAGIPVKMTPLATGFISVITFLPDFLLPTPCGMWLDAAAAAGDIALGFNKIFILLIILSAIGLVSAILLIKRTKSLEKEGCAEASEASC